MHWKNALGFILLLGTGICPALWAAPLSRVRSLIGVETVQVVVEDLNYATQKAGVHKEHLQAAAEKFLLERGLKVTRDAHGTPIVYIRLSSVIGGGQMYAPVSFYLTVQVKQFARLAQVRAPTSVVSIPEDPPLLVTTWEDGAMVMLDRQEFGFYISQMLTNLLSVLVQDYEEANGKKDG